jgi:hypothetical protein
MALATDTARKTLINLSKISTITPVVNTFPKMLPPVARKKAGRALRAGDAAEGENHNGGRQDRAREHDDQTARDDPGKGLEPTPERQETGDQAYRHVDRGDQVRVRPSQDQARYEAVRAPTHGPASSATSIVPMVSRKIDNRSTVTRVTPTTLIPTPARIRTQSLVVKSKAIREMNPLLA